MLFCNINLLLNYCKSANFSIRAIQALTIQCKELKKIKKHTENTTNPVYQKCSLPASDKNCSRLQLSIRGQIIILQSPFDSVKNEDPISLFFKSPKPKPAFWNHF